MPTDVFPDAPQLPRRVEECGRVLQYGHSVAATTLHATSGWSATATFWVLALWVMFQAGAAALTAALRHHSAIAPSRAMLVGALLCAAVRPHSPMLTRSHWRCSVTPCCAAAAQASAARRAPPPSRSCTPRREACEPALLVVHSAMAPCRSSSCSSQALPARTTPRFSPWWVLVLAVVASCGLLFRDPPLGWWPPTSIRNCGPVIFPTDWATPDAHCRTAARGLRATGAGVFGLDSAGRTLRGVRRTQRVGRRRVLPAARRSLMADYFGERNAVETSASSTAQSFSGAHRHRAACVCGVLPALMGVFVAAGLISLCAAVTTRLLHRLGYPSLGLPR